MGMRQVLIVQIKGCSAVARHALSRSGPQLPFHMFVASLFASTDDHLLDQITLMVHK